MTATSTPERRVLVAIPAYNEAATIESVTTAVRRAVPQFELLVVNDGSTDATGEVLARSGLPAATHLCNLGYGRALQTALIYAERFGYDEVITFDADGQHRAGDLARLHDEFVRGSYDLLIGSRFVERRGYDGAPAVRRLGMRFFSLLIRLIAGRRVYDTSSGLKVIGRRIFRLLSARPAVDFHAETLVYLIRSGYSVGESPIEVGPREHGQSMYGALSTLTYPLKLIFLIVLGALDARRTARKIP